MQTQRLGSRQLFNMLRDNLEKRIIKFYSETKDVSLVIEYAVAVLVRHCLSLDDFSFICKELIRELFLTAAPNQTLRRFSVFFENYFTPSEWKTVVARLYRHKADYHSATEEARLYKDCLKDKDPTRTDDLADHHFNIRSVFKGENGRKQTWILKNGHPTKGEKELAGAVKILTMLTIFETSGVRKFAEFVGVYREAFKIDTHYVEGQDEQAESVEKAKTTKKPQQEKKDSRKKEEKQKKKAPIGNNEDITPTSTRELIDAQVAENNVSAKANPKKTGSAPANRAHSDSPPKASATGDIENKIGAIDKAKEPFMVEQEQEKVGLRKRFAQILGRGS